MKKISLLLLLPLLLAGCSEKELDPDIQMHVDGTLSIMTPTGAPAVVFSAFIKDSKYEPSSNPQTIIAQMTDENVDIAVLPTNAGVQQIVKKGLNYKIASTITFGNLFVVSSGTDDDGVMDAFDNIYLFGKDSVPHKIYKSVYGIDVPEDHFKNTSADIKTMIEMNDSYDYALIAEPDLSSLQSKGKEVAVYSNVQTDYKTAFGGQEIFQASIFVRNDLVKETVDSYLSEIQRYSGILKDSPEVLNKIVEAEPQASSILAIDVNAAISSIKNGNKLGIGFKYAYQHKTEIDTFLQIFGMGATSEEIYYK